MSGILDIKSKKGMSLAYVLVVCLFLMMITGGIVSVALLQHNETGSDLNVRQAYISAKSGLDTMQDSLKNKVIASGDLPIAEGGEVYYIMYVDTSDPNGEIHYEYRTTEEAIKELMVTMEADTSKTIVGGEGTYFKIKKTSEVDYKVTALNTTGKYNNNTTLNQGDLSVGVAVYKSYVFGDPEPPTTNYYTPSVDSNSDFLMVGMQNSVNSVRSGGWSAYKTLNSMHKINSGGSGGGAGTQEIYVLDTQSNTGVCESFAPLVYDQTVRLTSSNEHSQISAYNEGIYFLGSATGDEINDYAFEGGNRKDLGQTSFFTQNSAYAPSFNCALLVISHNVNAVDISPRVSYYGSLSRNFVYVYLENDITFNMCNGEGKSYNYGKSFTKFSGWYKVYNGELFDKSKWVSCGEPSDLGCKNHLGTIRGILASGCTLHSGGPETQKKDVNVNILDWNGDYNTRSTPGGTGSAYIYFSPSKAPYTSQEYTWKAKSFNLYWTGTDNFKLLADAKVTVGGPDGSSFVVTMPFNKVIEQGSAGASFKVESDVIQIMNDITVKFNSPKTVTTEYNGDGSSKTTKTIEEYVIKSGTYNVGLVKEDGKKPGVKAWSFRKKIYDNKGFDLFSEVAFQFFDVEKTEEDTSGEDPAIDGKTITLTQKIFNDPSGEYTISKEYTDILYKNPTADKKAHTITVTGPFKLKKQLKNNSVIVLMEFKTAGVYLIPVSEGSTEDEDGIELDGSNLDKRATWVQSNYKCLEVTQNTSVDDKGYY